MTDRGRPEVGPSTGGTARPGPTARRALTLAWLVGAALLFRYWDVTIRFEQGLVWSAVFTLAYAATLLVTGMGREGRSVWSDVWLWGGIVVAAALVQLLFPQIELPGSVVQTVAFLRVLDIVIPLWILHRAVRLLWPGRVGLAITATVPVYLLFVLWWGAVRMPLESHSGAFAPLTDVEADLRDGAERHVRALAEEIGVRGSRTDAAVDRTVAYLRDELQALGYDVEEQPYRLPDRDHVNLQVSLPGTTRPDEIVVVGAHYDTYDLTPGADDNATGVAAVLLLAELMRDDAPGRTLRFVLFGSEEPPYFNTDHMGSRHYARRAAADGEEIVAMLSLEMLGTFSDEPGTQRHPPPMQLFFPDRGDFVAFVGNPGSADLLRTALRIFRESTAFPSEGVVSSSMIPGVELSDHASFWRAGYPAIVVSDTGPFRNDHYHLDTDTPDRLDFERMARVVAGVHRVVSRLVEE